MPNWTTNGIACHKDCLALFVNGDNVDFNLLDPMPDSLNLVSGGIQINAVAAAKGTLSAENLAAMSFPYASVPGVIEYPFDVNDENDLVRLGEVYLENEKKYGAQTWYEWCTAHWHTKWNATDTVVRTFGDLAVVTFDTAWSAPNDAMFEKAFAKSEHPLYYGESYDEDYYGVYHSFGEAVVPTHSILQVRGNRNGDDATFADALSAMLAEPSDDNPDISALAAGLGIKHTR